MENLFKRILLKITGITIISLFTALLPGCGFQVNSSPSGGTGGPVAIGGQVIPVPPTFQPLTGCTNPNTGTSSGDWGVETYPVYTIVDATTPVVGVPVYTSNSVFWTSRENAPGQSILLAGAFTDTTRPRDWLSFRREPSTGKRWFAEARQ
jgi:hypothetical protein